MVRIRGNNVTGSLNLERTVLYTHETLVINGEFRLAPHRVPTYPLMQSSKHVQEAAIESEMIRFTDEEPIQHKKNTRKEMRVQREIHHTIYAYKVFVFESHKTSIKLRY